MGRLHTPLAAWGICIGVLLLTANCGGRHGATELLPSRAAPPADGAAADLLSALPPLPTGRAASATQELTRLGAETINRSANAVDEGTALRLNAGAGALEWGIWGWDATGLDIVSLAFDVDVPPGSEIYLALANYAQSRWELYGPLTDDAQYPLDDLLYKSPGEGVYCAALAYNGSTPAVLTVTLTVDTGANLPPVADLFAGPVSGQAPLMVYFDASGSFDNDGYVTDFEWDLDGDGVFNEDGNELTARGSISADYTYFTAGDYTAQVRVTDDGGLTGTAGQLVSVTPPNEPPVADLQADPTSGATPLAVTLDATGSTDPEADPLTYQWDFDGDGVFNEPGDELASEDLATAVANYYSAGTYDAGVRVEDTSGATDTATVQITVTGNQAPVADLQADVTSGDPPLTVNFDASGSSDSDGSIVDFLWDLDGNGIYNEPGPELDAWGLDAAQFSYAAAGEYHAAVLVFDNQGGTDEASLTILVHGWVIVPLQPGGYYAGISLKEVDGRPALVYSDGMAGRVYYAYSTSGYGGNASDWSSIVLDGGTASWTASLAVVNGNPAVAYEYYQTEDLRYARSSTPGGELAGDWSTITVNNAGETSRSPSLAVIDGRPAIAYQRGSIEASELMYALSSTATGGSAADWDYFPVLSCVGEVWISLAQIDAKPAVAFYEDGNSALQYAFASTADGAAAVDWSSIILDTYDLYAGEWCSLASIAGKPAISYGGVGSMDEVLRYAVSATAQGGQAGDWTALTVDGGPYTGYYTSLAEVGGKPAVAYYDMGLGVLRFAASSTVDGGDPLDWTPETVDASEFCGENASLAVINGCPAISYFYDGWEQTELRYAVLLQ